MALRKTILCFLILVLLSFPCTTGILFIKSEFVTSAVSIDSDGNVVPSSAPIEHSGNVYTLTGNISGSLSVHRSNIVIDGAGYALNGYGGTGIDLTNNLTEYPSMHEIRNVTVENLGIIDFNFSINARGSSQNTFYNDYIGNTTNNVHGEVLLYWNAGGNNITRCTIIGTPYAIGIELSSGNTITENNLVGSILMQFAGNETVDRNYWSDYFTKYPNATEIDLSGIGNTPYVLDTHGTVTGTLQDNHPQMNPVQLPLFPYNFQAVPINKLPSAIPEFPPFAIAMLMAVLTLAIVKWFRMRKNNRVLV